MWSSNFAYIIGLITTDGCLSSDKRHIILTSTDFQLLNTYRNCLNRKNRITINPPSAISKKTCYRIQIGDVKLYRKLIEIGLFPNKSLTLGKLDIPNKYLRDFLRGHIDGDGSIIYYKDKYNTYLNPKYIYDRLIVQLQSSSKKHILWLKDRINKSTGLKGCTTNSNTKTQLGRSPSYKIKFSTKEAKILLNWIYYKEGLPKLERKYNIARPFLSLSQ